MALERKLLLKIEPPADLEFAGDFFALLPGGFENLIKTFQIEFLELDGLKNLY